MSEIRLNQDHPGLVLVGYDEYEGEDELDLMPDCMECLGDGWIDCRCGGDTCCCRNNGEMPCPFCPLGLAT